MYPASPRETAPRPSSGVEGRLGVPGTQQRLVGHTSEQADSAPQRERGAARGWAARSARRGRAAAPRGRRRAWERGQGRAPGTAFPRAGLARRPGSGGAGSGTSPAAPAAIKLEKQRGGAARRLPVQSRPRSQHARRQAGLRAARRPTYSCARRCACPRSRLSAPRPALGWRPPNCAAPCAEPCARCC